MPKFRKGSPEAKAYMAYLRSKRGKGGKKAKGGMTLQKLREGKKLRDFLGDSYVPFNTPVLDNRLLAGAKGKGLFKPIKWAGKLGVKGIKQLIKLIKKKKDNKNDVSGSGEGNNIQLPYNVGHLSLPYYNDEYGIGDDIFGFGGGSPYDDIYKKFLADTDYLVKSG